MATLESIYKIYHPEEVKNVDIIENRWTYNISIYHNNLSWFRRHDMVLLKYTLKDNFTFYRVEQAHSPKVVRKDYKINFIVDILAYAESIPSHYNFVEAFETEREAYQFLHDRYPKIDIKSKVLHLLAD